MNIVLPHLTVTSIALAAGILSALTSGYYGKISDKYGRKPVIAISTLGQTLVAVLYTLYVDLSSSPPIRYVETDSFIRFLAGSSLSLLPLASEPSSSHQYWEVSLVENLPQWPSMEPTSEIAPSKDRRLKYCQLSSECTCLDWE